MSQFKILVTVKSYDTALPTMQHNVNPMPSFGHSVYPHTMTTVNVFIVEFDHYDDAEFAFQAISASGHIPTRLYPTLPDFNTTKFQPS